MKSMYVLPGLCLLLSGFCEAQNQPSTASPESTTASPRSRPTKRPNRMQDLYDHYHSYSDKPTSVSSVSEAPVINSPAAASTSTPAPVSAQPSTSEPTLTTIPAKPESSIENRTVRIGARGGITYPLFLENVVSTDPGVGFVGGVVFQFGRGKLSFQPEINYSRITLNTDAGYGKIKVSSDQVVVPLFLKISSGTFAGNRFFVNVGPYGAFLASISQNGIKREIDSNTSRFAFGAAAGVGVMLKAGPGHVTIEARGRYALGNSQNGLSTDAKSILTEGTLGYIFPLGIR